MPNLTPSNAALALACIVLVMKYVLKKKEGPLPPGPKPRFLIGNALDIPFVHPQERYLEWSKKLNSSMIYLQALGNKILVLHDQEDAEELFEKRAAIYSDRPVFPTMELLGWDYNFGLFEYGDFWRKHRRISQQNFRATAVHKFYPVQIRKTHDMLAGLLDTPERFDEHNKILSLSIPLTTMYGYEVKSLDDPVIVAADMNIELGAKVISPGGSFANVIPILKYVPWTWTQRMAKEIRWLTSEMKRIPLDALLEDMAKGRAIPSLVGAFLEKKQTVGATAEDERIILNIANTVYSGAGETTISATRSFFYLITVHPEVQAKAQAELDRVLGSPPRLPTFEDTPSLPYIEAIYREVLRWYPPVYLGVPHTSTADDWYKGYFIPKGTTIFANVWAMNRDEERYGKDPYSFNPDRFIDESGNVRSDGRLLAYGFGRRGCLGKYLARNTLWLMIASVLACFNLRKPKDENGQEMEISDEFEEEGLMGRKAPFKCDITPRSEEWRQLIDATRTQGYKF
ncbi:cytochrome P450 [Panaeolus papilionaceus]|nr:cytochrome P450 [Panaeolus papilionaceus]